MTDKTSVNWLDTIWSNGGLNYGMSEDATMSFLLLATGLFIVAVGIGVHTFLKERGKKVSVGGAASHLMALFWLIPIVAVCVVVALPALWYFSSSPPMPIRHDATHQIGHAETHPMAPDETHLVATTNRGESSLTELTEAEGEPSLIELAEREDESPQPPINTEEVAATPERPTWVDAGEVIDGPRRLVVVQSQQFPQEQRARHDALQEAIQVVRADFQQTRNAQGPWILYRKLVKREAVKKTYVEPIQRSTGLNDFSVVRVYHQVELSDDVRDAIYPSWRGQIVDGRLWILGGLLGFITLMLGTAATYLRLDMLTSGNYRRRLKLASVSLIVAGGLVLANFLPLA